jgi:hypothetical protein
MPKSRVRKGHKTRVQNYNNQKKAAEKNAKKILMDEFLKQQEEYAKTIDAQKAGADVDNTDIDIDLEIDDIEIDEDIEISED